MSYRVQRTFRALVVGALAISALAASPALAGGRTGSTTAYKCSATPTSVAMLSTYGVSGSGFLSITYVNVYIADRTATWIVPMVPVAPDGTFAAPIAALFSITGTKTVSIVNSYDRRTTVLAKCTFSVY